MTKYNVKKIENTNTMTTTLTTSCKKRDTAINRFCRFLNEYDNCFKDSLLIATTHICYVGDCNNIAYKAVSETDEYVLTYTEYTPTDDNNNNVVFTVIIEFKHDENTKHYKSLVNTSVSDNTNDNKTATDSADSTDSADNNETTYKCYEFATHCKKLITALNRMTKIYPEITTDIMELKDTFEWYGGDFNECDDTTVYGDKQQPTYRFIVDFDGEYCYICMYYFNNVSDITKENDNKTATDSADSTDSAYNTSNKTSQTCNIKAYYDGEELTVPYSEYKCREHAVEYIRALLISRVVPYETLFVIYYGKHVETITIEMVLDIPELLQCNIEYINVGLKCDVYKDVRNGIERICALIDDNHLFAIGFVSANKTRYYTITKSNFKGYYNFKIGNNNLIQKPSEISRYLYYHTFKIWKSI